MSEISPKGSSASSVSQVSPQSNLSNQTGGDAVVEGKIDAEKIKHMAHLSRIGLSDQEAREYAKQMESIIGYMKILEEVKTEGVEMTMQVTGLKTVTRRDEVKVDVDPDALLATSVLPKISGQIAVKAVIKED